MSLIPLDEQRGDDRDTPGEGPPARSAVGRLWGRVTSALRAFLAGPSARPRESGGDESVGPALKPAETDGPASRPDTGRQEYVTTEHGERLTLALADNPDARITSDTWEPVER